MNKKVQVWILHQDEVLLFRVIPDRGGGWHPVTANLEKGEQYLDCAKRETFEETGIEADEGKWIEVGFSYEYEGRWGRVVEQVFALMLKERPAQIVIDPKEHADYCWMPSKNALEKVGFAQQKEALEKCIRLKI